MKKTEKAIEVLNDLIKINNHRITRYEKAAHANREIEPDIKNIFLHMASESRSYVSSLYSELIKLGGEPVSGTSTSGKLYRFWSDLKSEFTGQDTEAMLDSSEAGEDAALRSYKKALESKEELPEPIYAMILNQQHALQTSHDLICRYRDSNSLSNP
jgi:uncharacterized protein (TIGR02284 family)